MLPPSGRNLCRHFMGTMRPVCRSLLSSLSTFRSVPDSALCGYEIRGPTESGKAIGQMHRPCGKTTQRFDNERLANLAQWRTLCCTEPAGFRPRKIFPAKPKPRLRSITYEESHLLSTSLTRPRFAVFWQFRLEPHPSLMPWYSHPKRMQVEVRCKRP